MKTKIVSARCVFHGLYQWGNGWVSANAANEWHKFWGNLDAVFWHSFNTDMATYIITTGGGGMIHPMDFDLILRKIGVSYVRENGIRREIYPEMDELKKICENVAELCGGSCDFSWNVVEVEL